MPLTFRVLIAFTVLLFAVPVSAQDQPPGTDWCSSVWYPSSEQIGGMDSIAQNADLIDEVNPFWYTPAPDGGLIAVDVAENAEEIAAWREADLRILPSIFASVPDVIREDLRETHIQAIVETVLRMDYDGIDIDYEGFPLNTRDDFSLFVEGLAEALHAEGKRLSVTVHAKSSDTGTWESAEAQDWARLTAVADEFKIMTYDYTSRNQPPGPISPTAWVLDVLAYAETITDLSKVRMGLPFYGYTWQRGTPPATTTAWTSIEILIDNFNLTVERDANQEAYVDFKVTGLPRQVVYFADPVALSFKLEQVAAAFPDLAGVSIWGIGGENAALWDVLRDYGAGCRENE